VVNIKASLAGKAIDKGIIVWYNFRNLFSASGILGKLKMECETVTMAEGVDNEGLVFGE